MQRILADDRVELISSHNRPRKEILGKATFYYCSLVRVLLSCGQKSSGEICLTSKIKGRDDDAGGLNRW
jgi:hypothetical protein